MKKEQKLQLLQYLFSLLNPLNFQEDMCPRPDTPLPALTQSKGGFSIVEFERCPVGNRQV